MLARWRPEGVVIRAEDQSDVLAAVRAALIRSGVTCTFRR